MASISVIVTSYNQAAYIVEALESVLNQTGPASNVVVTDNASTDDTRSVLQPYASRVNLIFNSIDLSRPVAVNRAVALTSADYVAFLDGDDIWTPQHLEILAGLLDANPGAGLSFCCSKSFGGEEVVWPGSLSGCGTARDLLIPLLRGNVVIPSNMMVRRSVFDEVGGFDPIRMYHRNKLLLVDDYDFVLKVALNYKLIDTDMVLTRYRVHPGQNSQSRIALMNAAAMQCFKFIKRNEAHPNLRDRLDLAIDRVCMHWAGYFDKAWEKRDWKGMWQMAQCALPRQHLRKTIFKYLLRDRLMRRFGATGSRQ